MEETPGTKNLDGATEILYLSVFCLLFGIICVGQWLSILGIYRPIIVIPFSLIVAGIVFILYLRSKRGRGLVGLNIRSPKQEDIFLAAAFLIGALGTYLLLIFYPLARWPNSWISRNLTWDAGLYHFPKAVEMLVNSSSWDTSIAYGEYPFGYETLLAFSFILNPDGRLIGLTHAVISLFFILALAVLIFQRTKIPRAPIFFLICTVILSFQLVPEFDSNIWSVFWPQLMLIGKNDILIAAAMLSVLVFTPTSRNGPFDPSGLAMASMIAVSIKPNAILIIMFAWCVLFFYLIKTQRLSEKAGEIIWSIPILVTGVLWVVRNLIAQSFVFSKFSLRLSAWSIGSNLRNPFFYNYVPQHLYYLIGIILIAGFVSLFKRSMRVDVLAALVLFFTFIFTPASAFSGSVEVPAQIAWRFAIASLSYALLLLLLVFEKIIVFAYQLVAEDRFLKSAVIVIIALATIYVINSEKTMFLSRPENEIVLRDQYKEPVGVDGYHSAYDYVQRNVRQSVVWVENGLPYYLYDPEFTNSVTRLRSADYYVFLQTPWLNDEGYPEILAQPDWAENWQLIYEDPEGRVYKRR